MSKKYEIFSNRFAIAGTEEQLLISFFEQTFYLNSTQLSIYQSQPQTYCQYLKELKISDDVMSKIEQKKYNEQKEFVCGGLIVYTVQILKFNIFNLLLIPVQNVIQDCMFNFSLIADSKALIYTKEIKCQEDFKNTIDFYEKYNSEINQLENKYLIYKSLIKNKNFQEQVGLTFFEPKDEENEILGQKIKIFLVFIEESHIDKELLKRKQIDFCIIKRTSITDGIIDLITMLIDYIYSDISKQEIKKSLQNFFQKVQKKKQFFIQIIMSQEAIMILIDNSCYSRNGDCYPTRYQAQLETISQIIRAKNNGNPQTTFGLISLAGDACQVQTTLVNNPSQIYSKYSQITQGGNIKLSQGLQIAQLVLKHRIEKKQKERIIVFIASEITENNDNFIQTMKFLRKNQVSVDFINICSDRNYELIKKLSEIMNDEDSTFVNYVPNSILLQNQVSASKIISSQQQTGVDQEFMDEELQMVLRISLEEEQKRIEELQKKQSQENQPLIEEKEVKLDVKEEQQEQKDYLKDPQFLKEIMKDLDLDKKEQQKLQ